MLSLRRSSTRWMWPIAISLSFTVLLLAVSAASAQPVSSQPDRTPARPTAGLPIPPLPVGVGAPTINGNCSDFAYTQGITLTFTDQGGSTGLVHLLHDSNSLYVCLSGAKGTNNGRFAGVYLDTDNAHEALAEADDYALRINIISGVTSTLKGDGAGGYIAQALSGWAAAAGSGAGDIAEYQISNDLTGGACGQSFGLSVRHQQVVATNDDFGWPDGGAFNQPITWKEVTLDQQTCGSGKIAYVYRVDTATASDFKALLEGAGYTVQLIAQSSVTATNFSAFDLTIIADDTGYLNQWSGISVTPIITAHKPIIGLGEGGYAFFGRVPSPIGWPNGWHGPQANVLDLGALTNPYYTSPNNLSGSLPGPFPIYGAPVNEVGIYMAAVPASVIPIGWEPPSIPTGNPDHASLTLDGCYHLWGYSGSPIDMNGSGRNLFLNAMAYMRFFQCPVVPPPPANCVTVVKTAQPVTTTSVSPGTTIRYTLSYTVTDNAQCALQRAELTDQISLHTLFVPGSASDDIIPNSEDTLLWSLGPKTPGATGSKSFSVTVLDTACHDDAKIVNQAELRTDKGIFKSNQTQHTVSCPPVTFPNEEPPYVETEVTIYPYPIVTGHPTELSVQVRSLATTTQVVTVSFQTSSERFGIGIPFSTLPVPGNPRVVTLPPGATVEVKLNWVPFGSGHYCIQVKVEGTGFAPLYTQRNIDVMEDLQPGVTDELTFAVANPTAASANITLTVDNDCPSWLAYVDPDHFLNVAPNSAQILTATLHVTPPTDRPLGTRCHIDVQGWVNGKLIGGIRKLDVPPVYLPPGNPPWLEREISTIPTVPISGTVNQLCVELQNPWPVTRVITVTFSEADFGAGIGFTPRATQVFTLPHNSLNKYCINWTPLVGGTLHRCLLVELDVPGFQPQLSQRNVDLVRRAPLWNPGGVAVPFVIGNPNRYPSEVNLNGILIGLNNWLPQFDPPPPYLLGPGVTQNVMLHLVPAVQRAPDVANAVAALAGDVVRADMTLLLDGEPTSGFSVEFTPPLNVLLPIVLR
jgi:hypothetical protein